MDQNLTIQLTLCTSHIQGDQAIFEILAQTFHYIQIIGLDVCARKPLIATCSIDKSVILCVSYRVIKQPLRS